MKNPHKALKAIEMLVGSDLGMDLEWWLSDPKRRTNKRLLENAATVIGMIYKIAHSETTCTHQDWEKEKDQVIKKYQDI